MKAYWPPATEQTALINAALRLIQADHYSRENDPHGDAESEYAAEKLALAARALARVVHAKPPKERPIHWDMGDDDATLLGKPGIERDEFWSLLDWSMWGSGFGDTLREPIADAMVAAISEQQHADALRIMEWWEKDKGKVPVGRRAYETLNAEVKHLRTQAAEALAVIDDGPQMVSDRVEEHWSAVAQRAAGALRAAAPLPAAEGGE
jgi:hypothetical protein